MDTPVETGPVLTADDIFAMDDAGTVRVEIPEWPKDGRPGVIWVQSFGAISAATAEKMNEMQEKKYDSLLIILVCCCVDAPVDGKQIFTPEMIDRLRHKNFKVLSRLQDLALRSATVSEAKNDSAGAAAGDSRSS